MTAEREGLAEIAGVLADNIGSELYASLMEATADQWRRWDYMTDAAKEKYRAEGARIVAEAVTSALADLLAARDRRARAAALREAAEGHVAELVCCDVYERLREKPTTRWDAVDRAEFQGHSICYWGAAAAEGDRARADRIEADA